jgi:hypothetical protein
MADSDIGRDGGIGRRAGLRIQCRKRRAGSSPVPGTRVFPDLVEFLICCKSSAQVSELLVRWLAQLQDFGIR